MSAQYRYIVVREAKGLTNQPIWLIPVVNPQGTIKYIRANAYIQSSIVRLEATSEKDSEGFPVMSVQLKPGLEAEGWSFLRDLFVAEGPEGKRYWHAFQKWVKAGPMGTEGGQVKPWPDKYLPAGVKQRKERAAAQALEPAEIELDALDELDDLGA